MAPESCNAVFLSYASQDTDSAQRIAADLRQASIEVWFDQDELVGGDAWDQKIRKQIKECALFVPVISATTQARLEGYFRIEWKLAAQRMHAIADAKPFLLPIVIDNTKDADAHVPEEFRAVQWTRLVAGAPLSHFIGRIRSLLTGIHPHAPAGTIRDSWTSLKPASAGSVAVLAFANLSADAENEYFSDGISEELLNLLAQVPSLKVSARTSSFYFKGSNTPVGEIARQLGVAHIVEGSVRKSGNRVRISAQLIKAEDGFHVWSDTFTRELTEIFSVQDEIAGLIVRGLKLKLAETPRPAQAVNPEAHRLVLEGRHFWGLRTEPGFARAETAFKRAIEIAPEFAAAHAGLADVRAVRAWYLTAAGTISSEEYANDARLPAETAIRLDPTMAAAYPALAVVSFHNGRFDEAEQLFQKAFSLNPNFSLAYHWHAHLLAARGLLDASLSELERSIDLDPLATVAMVIYAAHLNCARRYQDVLAVTDRAIELRNMLVAPIQGARAIAYLGLGRVSEAVEAAKMVALETTAHMRWWASEEALYVLRRAGMPDEAEAQYASWRPDFSAGSAAHGQLLYALGRFDDALPFLRKTLPTGYSRFYFHPMWDEVREDPRFLDLIGSLNREDEYRIGQANLSRILSQTKR
jgi:TolB-like protein